MKYRQYDNAGKTNSPVLTIFWQKKDNAFNTIHRKIFFHDRDTS